MAVYEENMELMAGNAVFISAVEGDKKIDCTAFFDNNANNFRVDFNQKKYWLYAVPMTEAQAEKMLTHVPNEAEMVVLLGLGRGEILPWLQRLRPKVRHLIVIEPLQEVFRQFISDYHIRDVFGAFGQVSFVVNQTLAETTREIKRILHLEEYFDLKWGAIVQESYKYILPEYEKDILRTLYVQRRFKRVNENTMWKMQRMWSMNFWRNFSQQSIGIELFEELFREKPVIIVSAGPSLQKNIHLLEAAKEKAILIAVGSSITILEKNKIKPHFRMAIDAVADNGPMMECISEDDGCPLLFSNCFFFQALEKYPGTKVNMCLNSGGVVNMYFQTQLAKKRKVFRSGFSVANVAFDVAAQMGSNKIILVGQDLCYTAGRLHASGTWDEEEEEKFINEEMKATDFEGNVVATDSSFLGMREIFETFIQLYAKQVTCINATEGGLPIRGAENKSLQEVLAELPPFERALATQINELCSIEAKKMRSKEKRAAFQAVSLFIKKSFKLHRLYKKLSQQYQAVSELIAQQQLERIQPLHNELEDIYKQLEKHEFYHKFILPVFKDVHMRRRREVLENDGDEAVRIRLLLEEVNEVEEFLRMNLAFAREYCGGASVGISF